MPTASPRSTGSGCCRRSWLLLGRAVEAVEDAPGGPVRARLTDGERLDCDVLIGADGIRSGLRRLLFPGVEPEFTGFGVWRSMHDRPASLDAKLMMMGVGKRLGIMPISDGRLRLRHQPRARQSLV